MLSRITCLLSLLVLSLPSAQAGFEEGLAASRAGNRDVAFREFQAAAESGDERAYGKMGAMYLYGAGTATDFVKAFAWFDLAAKAGDKPAERFRDAAASKLTPEQLERAEALSVSLASRYLESPDGQAR